MSEPGWLVEIVTIASGILTLAGCVVLIWAIITWFKVRSAIRQARTRMAPLMHDVAPLLASLRRSADNLEAVSAAIRADVETLHLTVIEANQGARAAVR